ncbi:MAG TPA: acyl-CoA dehydrogenase [Chryseosolibacter sp.]
MGKKAAHPSVFINKEFADILRAGAAEAERLNDLHPRQLNIIYRQKWFQLFVSKEYGGAGYSLPEVLKLEEGIAWADGSAGWVVTLCGGAAWFVGFLQPALARELLSAGNVCFAGSGAATGVAEIRDGGYAVTGMWKYASGSLHATAFTANCVVQKEGRPVRNANGAPVIKAFLFLKGEVILHRHWNTIGMRATGSHSFEVKDLAVPGERCFAIDPRHAVLKDSIYQYPFLQLAETTLTVNLAGMAHHFLDLCDTLLSNRIPTGDSPGWKGPDVRQILSECRADLDEHRFHFYRAVEESWQRCMRGEALTEEILQEVTRRSYALARKSTQSVDELYPYCGLVAADPTQEINRVWRDLHTASQHALFRMR